jgi:D-alanyl-D-alanine carboxypeptidase
MSPRPPSRFFAPLASFLVTTTLAVIAGCDGDDSDDTDIPGDVSEPEPPAPNIPPLTDAEIADLMARADAAVAAGIPGVVLVVRAGDQTVRIARGVADRATGEPLVPDARLRVASMAKSVVSAIVLQLVDEGALSLGDTVDHWLPGVTRNNPDATIEDLLRLESGIPDYSLDPRHMAPYYAGDFDYGYTPEALVALANDHEPEFAPGEGWSYSNTNYALLAMVIERITGALLADVVAERITGPLGMTRSGFLTTGAMPAPFAHGYMVLDGDLVDVTGINASSVYGAGNLVATAEDMVTFYRALAAGAVVPEPLLSRMIESDPHLPATRYGMGLWRFDDQYGCGHRFYGHDGAVAGYLSTAYTRADGGRQYAVIVTSLTPDEHAGTDAAQQAWAELNYAAACPQ